MPSSHVSSSGESSGTRHGCRSTFMSVALHAVGGAADHAGLPQDGGRFLVKLAVVVNDGGFADLDQSLAPGDIERDLDDAGGASGVGRRVECAAEMFGIVHGKPLRCLPTDGGKGRLGPSLEKRRFHEAPVLSHQEAGASTW